VLGVYLRTARYYRPGQIAARLRLGLESALRKRVPGLARRKYAAPADLRCDDGAFFFVPQAARRDCDLTRQRENAARLQQRIFRFLNKEQKLGTPVNWAPAESTRLWCYNLHYFEYTLDLAVVAAWEKDAQAAELMGRLFAEWMDANPVGEGVGWHSYPIARRIVNWIQAVGLAGRESVFRGGTAENAWLKSLYQQSRYLEDHLEVDVLGNHLLTNGKSLVFAGIFFGGEWGARWFEKGQRILWRALEDQILEDGGHEERSPMYHAIVLQDYVEVLFAYQLNKRTIPDWVRSRVILMADYLDSIRHPDGEIPLFADSAFGIAHASSDILAACERLLKVPGRWKDAKPGFYCALLAPTDSMGAEGSGESPRLSGSWPATGYVKFAGGEHGDAMIVDTRPMGPLHLPAHGHCSLFSYELSIDGQRVIVDSGVEEYQPGPWRSFWRSTRAHNTVSVDGAEQTEIWGAFRAGQRVKVLESAFIEQNGSALFTGLHSGFAGQRKPTPHRRTIAALGNGAWVILDEVKGEGRHIVENFVHFAPKAICRIGESHADVHLDAVQLNIYPYVGSDGNPARMNCTRGEMDPIQGWYAPEFGIRQANSVLCFSYEVDLPARLGYLITARGRQITRWNAEFRDVPEGTQIAIAVQGPDCDIEENFHIPG
jgi:uncharacterized heparinase superfamily protein